MPARRATASIVTPWNPCSPTSSLVTSRSCSRRSAALMRCVRDVTLIRFPPCSLQHRNLRLCNRVKARAHTMTICDQRDRAVLDDETVLPAEVDVAVIGSGFSGLATAVGLKRSGREDFVVLERARDVGGTWRDNAYPGCACDVPSHLYSFSFAPNPDWSSTFSPQPEIHAYLRRVAEQEGVLPHVRFGCEVEEAAWDEAAQRWRLRTSAGRLSARVVVAGAGPLSEPAIPDIPGLRDFQGTVFHSATWDHEHDLDGERAAVIGTGASAIQFVPQIQPRVGKLHLFQRTAPWIMPRPDRPLKGWERRLYRALPAAQLLMRAAIYWARESFVVGFRHPKVMRWGQRLALRHLHRQV